jgi:hypothetical protein
MLLWLAACSSTGEGGSDAGGPRDSGDRGDASEQADVDLPNARDAVGRFAITLVAAVPARDDLPATPAFTSLLGRVHDAEVPQGIVWTEVDEEGDCKLFEPSIPACDPACTRAEVCSADDSCAAYPRSFDVGTVTLRGLNAESGGDAIALEPLPPTNTYQLPRSVRLPYPPFAEGAPVSIEAEGGELSGFSVDAVAIAPLAGFAAGPIVFAPERATELRWTPPDSAADSRVRVRVDISHHGGQKGEIVCDAPDSGSLLISARLGAALIDLGVAGFPSLEIAREAVGSTQVGAGRVELAIASPATIELEIPGLVSCEEPGEPSGCPDGQLCGVDRRCQ